MHLLFLLLDYHRSQQKAILSLQRFVAILPGQVVIDRAVWKRCFSTRFLTAYAWIGAFFALGCIAAYAEGPPDGPWFLLTSAIFSVFVIQGLLDAFALAKAQCDRGCLVPARVLRVDPFLIAVYSDLSQAQDGSWPAIRILKQPLERARGPRLRVGDDIVALARYTGTPNKARWDTFEAIALPCVTDDQNVVEFAFERLVAAPNFLSWEALDRWLPDVKRLDRPGFHILRKPERTNWLHRLQRNRVP